MTETLTHFSHRTGQSMYQRCPRSWWWGQSWEGIGLTRVRLDIPLARGIYVHRGLDYILQGRSIDESINHALTTFDTEIGARGLDVTSLEDSNYVYNEQKALIEAMLYGWWKKRYPELLERYDILEVEREEVWEVGQFDVMLSTGTSVIFPQPAKVRLIWLGRVDALLREKDSNDLHLQSFKTTAEWDTRKDSAASHDIQGLSELCAVEHRLEEWWQLIQAEMHSSRTSERWLKAEQSSPVLFRWLFDQSAPPKIQGIRMEHLLAGQRMDPGKGPKKTGRKVQYSPLIRGYKKDGITPDLDEYAYKFQWDDEYGMHRLGKGWAPFNAWEQPGGVRAWIDKLAAGGAQADLGDALDAQFVYPQPYYRQAEDVEDWQQQMIAEELRKFEAVEKLRTAVDKNQRRFLLNVLFPQFRHSCDYPRLCWAAELCFSPGYADYPDTTGLYQRRDPHHAAEKDHLVQIEGIE